MIPRQAMPAVLVGGVRYLQGAGCRPVRGATGRPFNRSTGKLHRPELDISFRARAKVMARRQWRMFVRTCVAVDTVLAVLSGRERPRRNSRRRPATYRKPARPHLRASGTDPPVTRYGAPAP